MKAKPSPDRIPYRRGPLEEAALQELAALRSDWIPALSSDNQWLRFAVRLLAELWQLGGKQTLSFQLGTPAGASSLLHVPGAPPTSLSSSSGEARLKPAEAALLMQLERELGHPSRSATLRHALFACRQLCVGMAGGDRVWLTRDGQSFVLPSLIDIASSMEQVVHGSIALLSGKLGPAPAPIAPTNTEARASAALLFNVQMTPMEFGQSYGDRPLEYSTASEAFFAKAGIRKYDVVCFEAKVHAAHPASALPGAAPLGRVRILLRAGEPIHVESVLERVPAAPSQSRRIASSTPKPAGDSDGLEALLLCVPA